MEFTEKSGHGSGKQEMSRNRINRKSRSRCQIVVMDQDSKLQWSCFQIQSFCDFKLDPLFYN